MDFDGEKIYKCGDSLSKIYKCGEVVWSKEIDYTGMPFTLEAKSAGTITFTNTAGTATACTLQYQLNDGEWLPIFSSLNVEPGDKVRVKSTINNKRYYAGVYFNAPSFRGTALYEAYGNIMSLLDKDNFMNMTDLTTVIDNGSAFERLFYQSDALVDAKNLILPATKLSTACYDWLFHEAHNLVHPPKLPATAMTYACYNTMFYGCSSLVEAPELPATTLAQNCYNAMFYDCTSLAAAPELPATALTVGCYNSMFYGCSSLVEAPELPATALSNNCYYMMFIGCTNLTATPELPATTLAESCYTSMFADCKAITAAPELPATTLAGACYMNMFQGCSSLTEPALLPALTLVEGCYSGIFYGCPIDHIICLATDISAPRCTSMWLYSLDRGTFYKNPQMNDWAKTTLGGTSGVPYFWDIVDYEE